MLHKVSDLPIEARGVVENLIGRPLKEDETFSIRPIRVLTQGPAANVATDVADRLERYFGEVDAQHPPVSEEQATAALDEAMRHARPGYTSVQ